MPFMSWRLILILIAGSCFCISGAGYIFVKIALRPKDNSDWEQAHWEFEDRHPALSRYHFWCKILFTAVIASMLLLFVAVSV